jgi:hypothetical protein
MQTRPISRRGLRPAVVSRLAALPLLAALLALGAAPARATSGTISAPWTGPLPIEVNSPETLTITAGGSVTSDPEVPAIVVKGGTLIISGGSVTGDGSPGIAVSGGTVNISGGSISGPGAHGVLNDGGTVNITGGSISDAIENFSGTVNITGGSISGVLNDGGTLIIAGGSISVGIGNLSGTVSLFGCLTLAADGYLTGTLQDGRRISTPTFGLSQTNLIRTCAGPYEWSGFLPPINPDGSSVFKLGRTVPVKFALTGASAGITNAVARLFVAKVSNNVVGTEEEGDSSAAATEGNLFRYDSSGEYVFNLGTSGLTEGTYELHVDLGDGDLTRSVRIGLR